MSRVSSCLVVGSLLGLVSPALAYNPDPRAVFYYSTEAGDPTATDALLQTTQEYPVDGTHTQSYQTTLGSTAISTSTDTTRDIPGFRISATAIAVPDVGGGPGIAYRSYAQAETNIIFDITPVGPAGALVPVNVKALLLSTGSQDPTYSGFGLFGIATAYTDLEIRDNVSDSPPDDYVYASCPFHGCPYSTVQNIDKTIELTANKTYEVQEAVFVSAGALPTDGTTSASASADPIFEIPYNYHLDNPDVSLLISPGLQSLITVPEPAAWVSMLVGFAFCGASLRRRRPAISTL